MNEAELQKVLDVVGGWTYREWRVFAHVVNKAFETETNSALNRVKLSSTEGLQKMLLIEMGFETSVDRIKYYTREAMNDTFPTSED